MNPNIPDADGLPVHALSRHQARTADINGSCVQPSGKARLRLGEARLLKISLTSPRPSAKNPARRRPQVRLAWQLWGATHAHAAWKTLVLACAATR